MAFPVIIAVNESEQVELAKERQNSYAMNILSTELLADSKPNTDTSIQHAETIRVYTKHLEQRPFAATLCLLYPELSPEKALTSASERLKKLQMRKKQRMQCWLWG